MELRKRISKSDSISKLIHKFESTIIFWITHNVIDISYTITLSPLEEGILGHITFNRKW